MKKTILATMMLLIMVLSVACKKSEPEVVTVYVTHPYQDIIDEIYGNENSTTAPNVVSSEGEFGDTLTVVNNGVEICDVKITEITAYDKVPVVIDGVEYWNVDSPCYYSEGTYEQCDCCNYVECHIVRPENAYTSRFNGSRYEGICGSDESMNKAYTKMEILYIEYEVSVKNAAFKKLFVRGFSAKSLDSTYMLCKRAEFRVFDMMNCMHIKQLAERTLYERSMKWMYGCSYFTPDSKKTEKFSTIVAVNKGWDRLELSSFMNADNFIAYEDFDNDARNRDTKIPSVKFRITNDSNIKRE